MYLWKKNSTIATVTAKKGRVIRFVQKPSVSKSMTKAAMRANRPLKRAATILLNFCSKIKSPITKLSIVPASATTAIQNIGFSPIKPKVNNAAANVSRNLIISFINLLSTRFTSYELLSNIYMSRKNIIPRNYMLKVKIV
jgi:hypothetical protein